MYILRIYIDISYIHVIYMLYTCYIRIISEPDVEQIRSKCAAIKSMDVNLFESWPTNIRYLTTTAPCFVTRDFCLLLIILFLLNVNLC